MGIFGKKKVLRVKIFKRLTLRCENTYLNFLNTFQNEKNV